MQILEISGLIEEGMWVDNDLICPPVIEKISSIDGPKGWEAHRITLYTLTGTYLEASAHVQVNGMRIADVNLGKLIRPAIILKLIGIGADDRITAKDLESCGVSPAPGEAVLVATGWDQYWNKCGYVDHSPSFTLDAVDWLLRSKPVIVGADFPCFDSALTGGAVVRRVFQSDNLLLGPLVNLNQALKTRMILIVLPLGIKGVCGSPCRALLVDYDELKESLLNDELH